MPAYRSSGTLIRTHVPCLGADVICSRPPIASSRSRIMKSPIPSPSPPDRWLEKPNPVSTTEI